MKKQSVLVKNAAARRIPLGFSKQEIIRRKERSPGGILAVYMTGVR